MAAMDPENSRLPNLLIPGVNKAGTTSVFKYLLTHPDVSGTIPKETGYYKPLWLGDGQLAPLDELRRSCRSCGREKYCMEGTPHHIYGGRAVAQAMRRDLGDNIRLVFVLREPVSRFVSFFNFRKALHRLDQDMTATEYIDNWQHATEAQRKEDPNPYLGVEGGLYAKYLEQWFEAFDDSQICVTFFEELKWDREAYLRNLSAWLDIEPDLFEFETLTVENTTKRTRIGWLQHVALRVNRAMYSFWVNHPRLKRGLRRCYYFINGTNAKEYLFPEQRERLQEIFHPYNQQLHDMLTERGYRKLPQWVTGTRKAKQDPEGIG